MSNITSDTVSPWIKMPEADWSVVTKEFSPRFYKKGTVIYRQNDKPENVYLIKSGRVRLDVYSPDGDIRTLFVAQDGIIFGELSPIDGLPNICSATAVTDCKLYAVPSGQFMEELSKNPQFLRTVLGIMARKLRLLASEIKQLSFNDSTYRVCNALYHLVMQHGETMPDNKVRIQIRFTHQEMANLTGLSRVSVSNIILRLTEEGFISKQDGYFVVNEPERLEEFL